MDTEILEGQPIWSSRVKRALEDAGLSKVADVMDYVDSGGDLLDIDGIGPAGAEEIEKLISQITFPLGAPVEPPTNTERAPEEDDTKEVAKTFAPLYGTRCPNCGVMGRVWQTGGLSSEYESLWYECRQCGHEWGDHEEQSPFRKIQRRGGV